MMKNFFQTLNKYQTYRPLLSPNTKPKIKLTDSYSLSNNRQNYLRYSGNEINDLCIQEVKRAKYQGFFDPGSYSNKNIFIDNSILINYCQTTPTKNNKSFKSENSSNKKLLIENEGKNIFVLETETKNPLITSKRRIKRKTVKSPDSYYNGKFDYLYNLYNNSQSIRTSFNTGGIVDLNKKTPKKIYSLKQSNKTYFHKYNELAKGNNRVNMFNDVNQNMGFNDIYKNETFGKNEFYDNEENKNTKKVMELMDGYLFKLIQLFVKRIKIFFRKRIIRLFFKETKEYIKIKEKLLNKNNRIFLTTCNSRGKNRKKELNDNSNILLKKIFIFEL